MAIRSRSTGKSATARVTGEPPPTGTFMRSAPPLRSVLDQYRFDVSARSTGRLGKLSADATGHPAPALQPEVDAPGRHVKQAFAGSAVPGASNTPLMKHPETQDPVSQTSPAPHDAPPLRVQEVVLVAGSQN